MSVGTCHTKGFDLEKNIQPKSGTYFCLRLLKQLINSHKLISYSSSR